MSLRLHSSVLFEMLGYFVYFRIPLFKLHFIASLTISSSIIILC
jgi:hypothetical protein